MATDLGKVGIVAKGTWNSTSTYEALDIVYYNFASYIAKQNVPANTAPTNTTYWQMAVKNFKPNYAGMSSLFSGPINAGESESVTVPGDGIIIVTNLTGNVTALSTLGVPLLQVIVNGTKVVFQTQAFIASNVRTGGCIFPVSSGDTVTLEVITQNLTSCSVGFVPYE